MFKRDEKGLVNHKLILGSKEGRNSIGVLDYTLATMEALNNWAYIQGLDIETFPRISGISMSGDKIGFIINGKIIPQEIESKQTRYILLNSVNSMFYSFLRNSADKLFSKEVAEKLTSSDILMNSTSMDYGFRIINACNEKFVELCNNSGDAPTYNFIDREEFDNETNLMHKEKINHFDGVHLLSTVNHASQITNLDTILGYELNSAADFNNSIVGARQVGNPKIAYPKNLEADIELML
ncbi:MAG: hypothetical protein IK070_00080 [Clostridia bacterium]|nr:hypothetical protein [Clostridia bacterium]